jgi:Delta24-sterol reductase
MPQAIQVIEEAIKDPSNDYVDGIMYTATTGVVCTGKLTDEVKNGVHIQRFTRSTDRWFYLHAKKLITAYNKDSSSTFIIEAVPVVDYLFRYDRGGFWVAVYAFKYFITPFNRITRWALDRFMHTRVMYHALHKSGFSSQYIIQDVAIPFPRSTEFMRYLDHSFRHYPIWLCPLKYTGISTDPVRNHLSTKTNRQMPDLMLNFGVWGPGPKRRAEFVAWNRDFEHKVEELGGQKWLYAHAYYTEEEFNEIYDRKTYDIIRKKYNATYLPSVYDKVKVDIEAEEKALRDSWVLWLLALFWSVWPLSGLYGVYHAMLGGDYLLPQNSRRRGEKFISGDCSFGQRPEVRR